MIEDKNVQEVLADEEQWETLTPTEWNPQEVGDQVVGVYVSNFDDGFEKQVVLETKDEGMVILPKHRSLKKSLMKVSIGDYLHVKTVDSRKFTKEDEEYTVYEYEVRRHKGSKPRVDNSD